MKLEANGLVIASCQPSGTICIQEQDTTRIYGLRRAMRSIDWR